MSKSPITSKQASYRFQRYHSSLVTGNFLFAQTQQRQALVRCFFNQSTLDHACGLHTVCSLIIMLDLAKGVALENMSHRKHGLPAEIWSAFCDTYHKGLNPKDMVTRLDSLELPLNLTLREAKDGQLDRWVTDAVMAGDLVMVVTANANNTSRDKHWTLAVGVDGQCVARVNQPQQILLLDPSGVEPQYTVWNSRLCVPLTGAGSRSGKVAEQLYVNDKMKHSRIQWRYESTMFGASTVVLMAAIRVRKTAARGAP